jgi:hypothetical protein
VTPTTPDEALSQLPVPLDELVDYCISLYSESTINQAYDRVMPAFHLWEAELRRMMKVWARVPDCMDDPNLRTKLAQVLATCAVVEKATKALEASRCHMKVERRRKGRLAARAAARGETRFPTHDC